MKNFFHTQKVIGLENLNISSEVNVKISPFDDWRDWFLVEEDKKRGVHQTIVNLYIDNMILVARSEVPINFSSIKFNVKIKPVVNMYVSKLIVEIPEMNISRERKFDRYVYVRPGDTVSFDFTIIYG